MKDFQSIYNLLLSTKKADIIEGLKSIKYECSDVKGFVEFFLSQPEVSSTVLDSHKKMALNFDLPTGCTYVAIVKRQIFWFIGPFLLYIAEDKFDSGLRMISGGTKVFL